MRIWKWIIWTGKGYDLEGKITYEINNGKVKIIEYDDLDLIFEGEYLYDKRNGKGKEYYLSGKINFTGEYSFKLRGKKWF